MECTGRVVAVSEPNAPNIVAVKYQKSGDSPELRRLARDIIRWECRPYPSIQPPPLAYFIKIFGPSGSTLPMFRQYHSLCLSHWRCPNAKQGLCNDRVSVCPSIVSPSFCLSVPSIDSSSCVWSVCCWAPPRAGRKPIDPKLRALASRTSCRSVFPEGARAQQHMRAASCWEPMEEAQHTLVRLYNAPFITAI